MESKRICCCGADTWSLVIGWLQTILYGILLLVLIIGTVAVSSSYKSDTNPEAKKNAEALFISYIVLMIPTLVNFIIAILLIKGVYQKNAGYLKVWIVIHIITLIFEIITYVAQWASANESSTVPAAIIQTAGNIFCIWVINVHRKELRD